jgi:hypothetical protein
MASSSRSTQRHSWTPFESHTLHCLLVRNVHILGDPERRNHASYPSAPPLSSVRSLSRRLPSSAKRFTPYVPTKREAYRDVATLLNTALNGAGTGHHEKDIDFTEISRMIDQVLEEKAGGMAVLQRQPARSTVRMTRFTRRVLSRSISFTGSVEEWSAGRGKDVMEEERLRRRRRESEARERRS